VHLDAAQKRAFIALACKVAWADGVVADEERAIVAGLVERLGGDAVSAAELDAWLATGAPPAELAELPPAIGEMFVYEAMRLVEADGDVSDKELALVEALLGRVAKRHEQKTPLARVALVKRA
jgi:uncharacterized tellurite resistance protein B-like protein